MHGVSSEEEVKHIYADNFKIPYKVSKKRDLLTPQILFEFKLNKNMNSAKSRSVIIAQALYYIRRIKYGSNKDPLPPIICIADKNEAFFTETANWKKYYSSEKYDWDCAASNPDEKLADDICSDDDVRKIKVFNILEQAEYGFFAKELETHLRGQLSFDFKDKKEINEYNFIEVYDYWEQIFGKDVMNGTKPSKYFLCDIQKGKTEYIEEENKLIFHLSNNEKKTKKIDQSKYERFWSLYERVSNPDVIREIITKLDCLTDEKIRRFTGEYFTPPRFAGKAIKYIEKVAGKKWWNDPNVRLWDMAAGTGNLEWLLPIKSHKHIYLSTLLPDDVNYCKRLFPNATSFKYDYLNDDIDCLFGDLFSTNKSYNLPDNLIKDLNNANIKWIIFINPPFGTAQSGKLQTGKYKNDISKNRIQKVMENCNYGEVSRELFSQFIYRIANEFRNKNALLCMFSKIKYLNSNNDQKLRDSVFLFKYERGFAFSSANFSGTSKASQFPVGFLIWDIHKTDIIEKQRIVLDLLDEDGYKISEKVILTKNRKGFLNKWIDRPQNSRANILPPLGAATKVKDSNKDIRHRICVDFIGSLMCRGNDFQNQNLTAIYSAPQASAGAHSITPKIFEQSMIVHAVRRLPKANWINDRDQFMRPIKKLSQEFINDCVVWSLFSRSNETSSLRNVLYKGVKYQITNHFFPFRTSEILKWDIVDKDIIKSLKEDGQDRFVANWLKNHSLSKESEDVLNIGKRIYKLYFESFNKLATAQFKIEWWDAGWWQIKKALQDQSLGSDLFLELAEAQDRLKEKLLPEIIEYGFVNE